MKVWLVEISDFLPKLDAGNRLYRCGMLANALTEAGHEILWWSSTFNHQLRRQRYQVSTTIEIGNNFIIRMLHGPGYGRSISPNRFFHNHVVASQFKRETAKLRSAQFPDLIYACLPTLEVCEKAVVFGVKHKIPVIVDVRDRWPSIFVDPFPKLLHPMIKLFLSTEFSRAKRIAKLATALTAVSPTNLVWALALADRQTSDNDKWFPLGYPANSVADYSQWERDEIRRKFRLKKNRLTITFVGTLSLTCNFKTVITAATELSRTLDDQVQFIFVGSGAQASFLYKKSLELQNVYVTGWCEKADVDAILSVSDIALNPYTSKAPQTLPNKPFEYMAAGLPILSSLQGEFEEILQSESIGLQFNADDPNDLKDKILWCLRNRDELKLMGRRAKDLLRREYDAEKVYRNFANHLCSIVETRLKFDERARQENNAS